MQVAFPSLQMSVAWTTGRNAATIRLSFQSVIASFLILKGFAYAFLKPNMRLMMRWKKQNLFLRQ